MGRGQEQGQRIKEETQRWKEYIGEVMREDVSEAEVIQAWPSISVGLTLSPTCISQCLAQCAVSELVLIKRAWR